MKNFILTAAILLLMAKGISQTPIDSGYCGAQGNNLTWTLYSDSTFIINGSGAMQDYSVNAPWYSSYRNKIKTLVITDGVTSIGVTAFAYCSNLIAVTIPNSVVIIGQYAFHICDSLSRVTIPDSVISIGDGAFAACSSLIDVTIGNNVTTIGSGAFGDCISLYSIIIPNSITNIGDGAFAGCINLTSVTIGNSVTTIGNFAFTSCDNLMSVNIGNSVTTIGNGAFSSCDNLTFITLGSNVTTIGDWAFFRCNSLTSITVSAMTPPALGNDVFENVPKNIPVFVPCHAIADYQTANYWANFSNFIGMLDTTFILDTVCSGKIYTDNGFIIDEGAGIYYRMETTTNNCDSIIQLTLREIIVLVPTDLNITQMDRHFSITWQGNVSFYKLYRNNILLATLDTTFYVDTNLVDATNYCYTVKAIAGGCESIESKDTCLTFNHIGIKEQEINKFHVYPNPTIGELKIENGQLRIESVEVFDIMGKKQKAESKRQDSEITINISHLPTEIYYIKIQTPNGIIVKKVIKY